jgi:RES domain-containing protein
MPPSTSLFLAALEYLVHVDTDLAPDDLIAVPADIPGELAIQHVSPGDLPRNWRRHPGPEALRDLGSAWAAAGSTAVLAVPSSVIPQERNYLLNPNHPDFRRIRAGEPEPFAFDPRLLK